MSMPYLRPGILVFMAILVLADQASKFWVEASLELYREVELLPFLSLFRTYNEGVAFSALSGLGAWPLIMLTAFITAFVLWIWSGVEKIRRWSHLGYAFVVAGAIGNLIDRIRIGKVVDMIFFHIEQIDFYFAIFNLADTFITIGAAFIIIDEIIQWRASKRVSAGKG